VQGRSESNPELLDAAALCRQLVPEGSVEAFLADHRHDLFPDEMFSDLFPSGRGRPSIPADVVASVMVLQALEGLSDRDAARALRDRISWKVACGLALDDEGFDFSVLTYWRTRLRKSQRPERIFDAVRSVIDATGVLKGKTRRALDSTLLDDAVATQDTVTQLIAAIRRVRRIVPGAMDVTVSAHDYESQGKPLIAWDDQVAKETLVDGLVNDALALLAAFGDEVEEVEAGSALGLLALVAGQDVEQGDDGTWKISRKVASDRVISTVDPEARHMHKSRSEYRDGYKAHIAIEPETGLVTAATLTPANAPDGQTGTTLLEGEDPGLQVLADGAYGSGENLAALAAAGHDRAIKPYSTNTAVAGGFHRTRCPSHPSGMRPLEPCAGGAHFDRVARNQQAVECFTSLLTTACSSNHVAHGETATSLRTTDDGARWWSARSRGSSPTTTGGSDSVAWRRTNSVCLCALPPSTSDDW